MLFCSPQAAPTMQMFDPFGASLPMASAPPQPAMQPQDPFLTPAQPKSQSYTSNHIPSPIRPQKLGKFRLQYQVFRRYYC